MTTSGTTAFDLDLSEIVEEAFERCGSELRSGYDLRTSRRSLNLLFADWAIVAVRPRNDKDRFVVYVRAFGTPSHAINLRNQILFQGPDITGHHAAGGGPRAVPKLL